jgi:hypothetical protein
MISLSVKHSISSREEKYNVRHLLVIDDEYKDMNKPIGITTPLVFTAYEQYSRNDEGNDILEKILEYYI